MKEREGRGTSMWFIRWDQFTWMVNHLIGELPGSHLVLPPKISRLLFQKVFTYRETILGPSCGGQGENIVKQSTIYLFSQM